MFSTFSMLPYLYRSRLRDHGQPTGTGTLEEPETVRLHRRFGVPQSYGGSPVSADDARQAQGQALVMAGSALLRGISENNMAGGLADAAQSYSGGISGALEQRRQMEREAKADELRAQQAEDSHLSSGLSLRIGEGQLDAAARAVQEREDEERRKREVADALAELVGQNAGDPNSPEAKRAAALALGGPDADIKSMIDIDETAVGRSRVITDAELKARAEAAQNKIFGAEGYGPIVESRRANERLSMDRQEHALRARIAAEGGHQASRGPTPSQLNDDVRQEGNALFQAWLSRQPRTQENKWINGAIRTLTPPTEAEVSAARNRAMAEAEGTVYQRYGLARPGERADGGMHPGVYVYDPKTGRMVKQ